MKAQRTFHETTQSSSGFRMSKGDQFWKPAMSSTQGTFAGGNGNQRQEPDSKNQSNQSFYLQRNNVMLNLRRRNVKKFIPLFSRVSGDNSYLHTRKFIPLFSRVSGIFLMSPFKMPR